MIETDLFIFEDIDIQLGCETSEFFHDSFGDGDAVWYRIYKHACGNSSKLLVCDGCKKKFQSSQTGYGCSPCETIINLADFQSFIKI